MKRIVFFIVAFIFSAMAVKVSLTPANQFDYASLSIDTKVEQVDQFFRYKVHNLQTPESFQLSGCPVKSSVCCNV